MASPTQRQVPFDERNLAGRAPVPAVPASALDRWLLARLLGALPDPGFSIELWDGTVAGDAQGPRVRIGDRAALWRVIRNPLVHFGDLYSVGRIDVEGDLMRFLERLYRAIRRGRDAAGSPWWKLWKNAPAAAGTEGGARTNIAHHYDLGNDFYRLWLDGEAMQYTCAYFVRTGMTLEAAQQAKMNHVCRKLRLQPGQQVFEAGCGWGGFAIHMARHCGVRVRAWNISAEQIRHARERARAEGLADRVEFVHDDYRAIRGTCDAFVSVGMLEHVGVEHYHDLGAVIARSLAREGLGLLHSIGQNQPMPLNAWIERRIFPGAYPPTLAEAMSVFTPFNLSVLDVENLRLHYAETLRHWRARYDAHRDAVRARYDERFARAWDLYLAGSQAAFSVGNLQLFQIVFAHADNNALPATRAHLYA